MSVKPLFRMITLSSHERLLDALNTIASDNPDYEIFQVLPAADGFDPHRERIVFKLKKPLTKPVRKSYT